MDISGASLDCMDAYPPLGVVVTDRQGLVIGWTPGAERLLGHTSAEARGRSGGGALSTVSTTDPYAAGARNARRPSPVPVPAVTVMRMRMR